MLASFMCVLNMATINERVGHVMDGVVQAANNHDLDYGNLEVRFNQEVQRCRELNGEVTQLRTSLHHLWGEVQNYRGLLNNVLMRRGDVEEEVHQACLFWVVQQHGPGNPIIVNENDETVADSEDECQCLAGEAEGEEDGEV